MIRQKIVNVLCKGRDSTILTTNTKKVVSEFLCALGFRL